MDKAKALSRVDGDEALLKEIIELFLDEAPRLLSQIQESIARDDAQALERAAHKLKGSVSNFAARAVAEAALRLESMGRTGDLAGAEDARTVLEQEFARLEPALAALSTETG